MYIFKVTKTSERPVLKYTGNFKEPSRAYRGFGKMFFYFQKHFYSDMTIHLCHIENSDYLRCFSYLEAYSSERTVLIR